MSDSMLKKGRSGLWPLLTYVVMGGPLLTAQSSCNPDGDGDGYSEDDGDCNDADAAVYPGAIEACDQQDNDCDGQADEVASCYTGEAPVVSFSDGAVQGKADDELTFQYLGIPFATPPVGKDRWKKPSDPAQWDGIRPATEFAPACPQPYEQDVDGDGEVDVTMNISEDCLYLNVWQPMAPSFAPRPVMVWVHGGANTTGAANIDLYDGARMAAQGDVIVVSVQYRLNLFGWLYHEALHTGDPIQDSGNMGLLDIQKSLEWVQRNVGAFGGDPSNVTVFGESAGGHNTWALQLSPLGEGLFHRTIAQSGYQTFLTPERARANAQTLLESMVVADGLTTEAAAASYLETQGTAWIQSYLYGKSMEELVEAYQTASGVSYDEIQDGVVMPSDAFASMVKGDYKKLPMLVGSNRDETKLFLSSYSDMTEAQYSVLMNQLYGDQVAAVEALYPRDAYSPATPYNQFTDIVDAGLELISAPYAAWLVSQHQPIWCYTFRYDNLASPYNYTFGAAHALELPFVFGVLDSQLIGEEYYAEGTEEERRLLSDTMIRYWTTFAHTGDPSDAGIGKWDPVTQGGLGRMVFDDVVGMEPVSALDIERINFWIDYNQYPLPPIPVAMPVSAR